MAGIRNITDWPPGVWVEAGTPSLVTPDAVLGRICLHDKGITLVVGQEVHEVYVSLPSETDRFKDIALL
jgi:hypothetical protein